VLPDHGGMREGTRLWKLTNKHVLALLNDLDPYGLEPGKPDGAPEDEYDLEAEPIARHLIKDGGIDLKKVDEIWLYWFEQTLTEAIGPTNAAQFVESLNALAVPKAPLGDTP
jgi:hypothetical protein